MFSLKHITEEELRRYYYLDGEISGKASKVNILNGVQQDYTGSCINNFISWNDECNKRKFELYVHETLPKLEVEYDKIVKKKLFDEKIEKYIIDELLSIKEEQYIKNRVLHRFKIPLYKYYHRLHPSLKSRFDFEIVKKPYNPTYIPGCDQNDPCTTTLPLEEFEEFELFGNYASQLFVRDLTNPKVYTIKKGRNKGKSICYCPIITRKEYEQKLRKIEKKINDKVDKICDNIQNGINIMCLS